VFDFYGEAGYRWEFAPNYTLTPFVGVDVGHAVLDSFDEKDPHDTGWALKVKDSGADSVETLVGGRFGGFWDMAGGVLRPEVMVAWAHEFEDPAEVDVAFRDAPRVPTSRSRPRTNRTTRSWRRSAVHGISPISSSLASSGTAGLTKITARTRSSAVSNTGSEP